MSLRDRIPVDEMPESDWRDVEHAVLAELEAEPASAPPAGRSVRAWRVALAACAVAAAVAALHLLPSATEEPSLHSTRIESDAEPVRASVGDVAIALAGRGAVVVVGSDERGWVATIEHGRARFAVPPRAHRPPLVVHAGGARVEVIGTRFVVERTQAHLAVEVERGRVRVTHDGSAVLLGAGQRWSAESDDGEPPREHEERTSAREPAPTAGAEEPAVPAGGQARPGAQPRAVHGQVASSRASHASESQLPADAARAAFHQATALERSDPSRAIALYARVASQSGPWAAPALFAQGRLELERGRRAQGERLLQAYLARHPGGLNADDARRLIAGAP